MSQETELRELYEKHGGDVSRVAHELGLSELPASPVPYRRRREPPADVGRPELFQYRISARHVDSPVWPLEDDSKIIAARVAYEAGTHEMCQGRDPRGWFVLYLIPRQKRAGARKFFAEGN